MNFFKTKIAFLYMILFFLPVLISQLISPQDTVSQVRVYNIEKNKIELLDESEYITGVVAAEMPAEFEVEALKAQSLAARTYLKSRKNCENHPDANICTDYTHCQAYKSKDELMKIWNDKFDTYYKKICDAVIDTEGEIIVYESEPISAVFHSTSSGKTENAEDVWGGDAPYLRSVESNYDEESPKFYSNKTISADEFLSKVSCNGKDIFTIIGDITYTDGGSIRTIEIDGKVYTGSEIRKLFDLNSSNFSIDIAADTVVFNVLGYGHGVGMSQYGANFMAQEGKNYKDIIHHYYTDVKITKSK